MPTLTPNHISQLAKQIYTQGSWARRLMICKRPYICPFEALISRVPRNASVLDVGCGDGLFLNTLGLVDQTVTGLGIDSNAVAIESAMQACGNADRTQDIEFRLWQVGEAWPAGEFDVVSMIDVLHHIPTGERRSAVQEAADHVKPGGIFLFKDIGVRPRWRAWFNSLHDLLLTGELVSYTPLDEVCSWVTTTGLDEEERHKINRIWYGHELALFRKPL